MTVSTEISSNEYTGNGVTTDFDYKFRIFKANQLSVITSDADGDNVVTLRLGTDYTVTGANKSAGGKVILTKPLANGHKISIARDIPITQEASFRNQSKFFAETHEDAFDYLTMIVQRIWGSLGSLYLKRPNILSNWFDAKGYRIANLGKPKRDSDAVDLGTLKDEISGVNSTILKREKRLLRVDDMDIAALPKASDRAGNVLTFDHRGMPIVVAPASGSAIDVINKIGRIVKTYKNTSDMKIDAAISSGSTVETIGYYEEDDGGGAVYYISEGVGDGYTSHSVGDGLVAKIIGNHIHILQAGAKENTDCYENIVSAFTNFTSVDCSVPYYINTSKPITVSPRRLKELQLKAAASMDRLFSVENMYNKVINDCRFDGNNLANICFYGDNGANTNKIDGLFAINGITHGIYYKNAYLASIRNFYARNITNGIGVYLSLAHNMKLERGEAHYCKYGIVVDSGASLNIDTIDSSYNTEADLIINTQAPSSVKNWYSEHSKGDMLRVGGYYSMVSIENAFLEMKDSTGGAIVISNSANAEARLIDATNVNIANAKNPFRKLGTSGVSNFIFSGKFDNVTDIDYSFAVQASVNGADIYRNGSLVFAAKGFNWDIGDVQIGNARVQYYQKTFSSYMDKIVFSEREAANSAIAVKVYSDKGAGTAFVMDGTVVSNGMPAGIVVQTNGNYVQLLNQNNNGVITKLICEVARVML
ncbi:hypothetical protein AB7206_12515 [Providencia alcalifaciens]